MKKKTKTYTRKAIKKYDEKFDRITVRMSKGTREHIKSITSESFNAYVNRLILEDLGSAKNGNISSKTHGEDKEYE